MSKSNKFTGLKEAIKERRAEVEQKPVGVFASELEVAPDDAGQGAPAPQTPKRLRGRPKGGKRDNPQFQQVTLYMPSTIYVAVQHELKLRRKKQDYRGPRDMSELVGTLVRAWHEQNLDHKA